MPRFRIILNFAVVVLAGVTIESTVVAADPATGWRGNGTGLWPESTAPVTWHRIAHGALEGMRASVNPPAAENEPGNASLIQKGQLREWLVLGPFPVNDSVKDFGDDPLAGNAATAPAEGQTLQGKTWTRTESPADDITVFGNAELPWLDLAKVVGFARNQLAYAHTNVFSPRGGKVRFVIQHAHGLQAWVNGTEVYRQPERRMVYVYYFSGSRYELDHLHEPAPRFTVDLKPGWNRLLFKLSTSNKEDFTDMRFCLRVMDPPDVKYETSNIRWMTELRGRSTSTPIIVRDRIFLMAEPDELICIDRQTGRVLWVRPNNYYAELTGEQRAELPALTTTVDPLVAQLATEPDAVKRIALRREIQKQLRETNEDLFGIRADDHFDAHFGIVGFTMPTPLCDGEFVYVWCGMGVAACYDLDGNRRWITRITGDHLTYGASPALIDGVLGIFMGELVGVDAATGKILWKQHRVRRNIAAVLPARFEGRAVFVSQPGEILDARTGELLHRPRGYTTSDTGWSPPVILGQKLYLPRYGVIQLNIFDFAAPESKLENPFLERQVSLPEEVGNLPDGPRVDRWTAGSPLIWEGHCYVVDIYQWLYVTDLATGKMTHRMPLDLEGFMHYNAVPVAASPTLVGKHIVICDNQGTAIVLEPGPVPKVVARNRIETQLERWYPLPGQETLTYAPPVCDGDRLYLRGERYLYCIGAE